VPSIERTPRDDAALVARLRAGDEEAFVGLVRQMHRALLRVAFPFVGSQAAAEEIVQDAWVAVIGGLDEFEGRGAIRTWVGRIVVNRAKTRGVRDRRSVPFSSLSADEDGPVEPERFAPTGLWASPPSRWETSPEELVLRREARAQIERELEALPPAQRTVVTLRDLEGWSAEEVCNVLDVSESNQRVLLHRGRARLRAALERYHVERGR